MSQEKVAEIIDLNASRAAAEAGGKETAGEFLAGARRAAGLDLAAVSDAIKVKIDHLEAIEASNAAALPATPYAVGFVKVYAGFLGLDGEALARQFKADIGADNAALSEQPRRDSAHSAVDVGGGAKLASIFGVFAILIFMIWVVVQIAGEGDRQANQDGAVNAGPDVILKSDAAPTPQPRPATAQPGDQPVVAVSEGGTLVSEDPSAAPATDSEETAAAAAAQEAVADVAAPAQTGDVVDTNAAAMAAPVIVDPRLTRSVAPRYPAACDRGAADLERVTVIFDITAEGRTANARVLRSTNACFNESALAALQRWRFNPKTVNGAPRPDIGKQATLNFQR